MPDYLDMQVNGTSRGLGAIADEAHKKESASPLQQWVVQQIASGNMDPVEGAVHVRAAQAGQHPDPTLGGRVTSGPATSPTSTPATAEAPPAQGLAGPSAPAPQAPQGLSAPSRGAPPVQSQEDYSQFMAAAPHLQSKRDLEAFKQKNKLEQLGITESGKNSRSGDRNDTSLKIAGGVQEGSNSRNDNDNATALKIAEMRNESASFLAHLRYTQEHSKTLGKVKDQEKQILFQNLKNLRDKMTQMRSVLGYSNEGANGQKVKEIEAQIAQAEEEFAKMLHQPEPMKPKPEAPAPQQPQGGIIDSVRNLYGKATGQAPAPQSQQTQTPQAEKMYTIRRTDGKTKRVKASEMDQYINRPDIELVE